MSPLFAFFPTLGGPEMILLLIVGVLLFGRKLPEVGRYLGKGIVEFKKGIRGLEDDVEGGDRRGACRTGSQHGAVVQQRDPGDARRIGRVRGLDDQLDLRLRVLVGDPIQPLKLALHLSPQSIGELEVPCGEVRLHGPIPPLRGEDAGPLG